MSKYKYAEYFELKDINELYSLLHLSAITMAKTEVNNPQAVTQYISQLEEPVKALAQAIREVVTLAHEAVGQHIKWNAPAFFYAGEMAAFNAKEYKRDIVVFNLRQKDHVLLIFPTGAKLTSPILEGDYTDGRRMVKVYCLTDLEAKQAALQEVIREWIKLVDE